ncbi:hypothetical protein V6M85_04080 [Sulfolobus tengchongensis]|uniref:Uncharacterized protein n=1 Tax=Sulfolobus tengchongensis TaxID=207809 RepID=A0AAX4L266_9CREN
MGFDQRKWALNWIKGSVISYISGKISLNVLLGRMEKSIKDYNVTVNDVKSLLNSLLLDPTLDVDEEVRKKVEEVLKFLESR